MLAVCRGLRHPRTHDPQLLELRSFPIRLGPGPSCGRAQNVHQKNFRGIRVTYVINNQYRDTNTGYSLMLASSAVGAAEFIKFDADVVFDTKILRALIDSDLPNVLCIDRNIALAEEEVKVIADDNMRLLEIGKSLDPKWPWVNPSGLRKSARRRLTCFFRTEGNDGKQSACTTLL